LLCRDVVFEWSFIFQLRPSLSVLYFSRPDGHAF